MDFRSLPHLQADTPAQNQYQALLRVSRQWGHLRELMRMGSGYPGSEPLSDGSLALFCPACPQPNINLPEDWAEDGDQ